MSHLFVPFRGVEIVLCTPFVSRERHWYNRNRPSELRFLHFQVVDSFDVFFVKGVDFADVNSPPGSGFLPGTFARVFFKSPRFAFLARVVRYSSVMSIIPGFDNQKSHLPNVLSHFLNHAFNVRPHRFDYCVGQVFVCRVGAHFGMMGRVVIAKDKAAVRFLEMIAIAEPSKAATDAVHRFAHLQQ